MSELVLGTDEGVFAFHPDSGKFHAEDGPGARVMLAAAGETCTRWRTTPRSGAGAGTTIGS